MLRLNGRGLNAHSHYAAALERATHWSTRYDEVVVDRYSLPDDAWYCKWSDIPPKAIEKACEVMKWWTKNDDASTTPKLLINGGAPARKDLPTPRLNRFPPPDYSVLGPPGLIRTPRLNPYSDPLA